MTESDCCFQIDVSDRIVHDKSQLHITSNPCKACILHSQSTHTNLGEIEICVRYLEANSPYRHIPL